MALIREDDGHGPGGARDTRRIDPKPLALSSLDPARIQISFDHRSDTLLIHLFGRDHDTISVPVAKYLYILVDPEIQQVAGLHIEGFLAQAVKDVPASIALLEFAELRGISPAEVLLIGAQSDGLPPPNVDDRTMPQSIQQRRREAIVSFIAAEQARWELPFLPAT